MTSNMTAEARARIVVVTHGRFAEGICDSLSMITGKGDAVEHLCAYVDPGVDYSRMFCRLVATHDYGLRPLIVVTDLLGGSVNNEFMQLRAKYPFILATGLNLPLLIELAMWPGTLDELAVRSVVEQSRSYVVICDDKITPGATNQEEDDF